MNLNAPRTEPDPGLILLVISADPAHAALVRATVGGWPLPATVEVATSAHDGIGRTLGLQPRLTVLDGALDGQGGAALGAQLLRLPFDLSVIVFDRHVAHGGAWPTHAWPWCEAGTVLDAWLVQHLDGAAAPAAGGAAR